MVMKNSLKEEIIMPKVKTEYEVEKLFIERLCEIGYEYIELKNYDEVLENISLNR